MAANATVFRVDTPTGADDPRDGDDRIREVKAALLERMNNAGSYWDNETASPQPDLDSGMPVLGQQTGLTNPTVDPTADQYIIYEVDKDTPAFTVDGSTTGASKLTLGDGKTGVNPYSVEVFTGAFEDLTVDNDATLGTDNTDIITINGDLKVTDGTAKISALPAKSLYGVYQSNSTTVSTLTTGYVPLSETVTLTTAAAAGDVLVTWEGNWYYVPTDNSGDTTLSLEIRRKDGAGAAAQIVEFATLAFLSGSGNGQGASIPLSVSFLDTGAVDDTVTIYDIRVKHTVSAGAITTSEISAARRRMLTCQEFIWN